MSLIGSLLAFVIIPLKAKPPKEADNLAVMALADEVKRLQFALDHWRRAWEHLDAENGRLREENRRLRQEEAGRQLYAQNVAMAQYQNQLISPLGQQLEFIRNCVPSRAQALQQNFHDDVTPGRIWRVDDL